MRANPLGGVDHATLERCVDLGTRSEDRRATRLDVNLATEARDANLEPPVVADRVHPPPEPAGHLWGYPRTRSRYEVEGCVGLLPEFESVALVKPGGHPLRIHAERHGREPRERRLLVTPVIRTRQKGLDAALGGCLETLEWLHDLTTGEHFDPKATSAHLFDDFGQTLCDRLVPIERRRKGCGHPPLDLRLGDDTRCVADGDSRGSGRHAARLRDESASVAHEITSHATGPDRTL